VQLKNLLDLGVKDQHFISRVDGQTDTVESESLINNIPMILGRRLPKKLLSQLVSDLGSEGRFLTEFGLASESPRSPKYEADGYWRGPIWAPSTYLIFDGLVDAGEKELAPWLNASARCV
jgi:glycogen debranching enzyme